MAQATLANVLPTFPVGLEVKAYADVLVDSGEPRPIGPELDSAIVNEVGGLTFDNLPADGTAYVAAAQVEGAWLFRAFATAPGPTDLDQEIQERLLGDAVEAANREVADEQEREAREEADAALEALLGGKQNVIPYVTEDRANKDTDPAMAANSDTRYPSQKAVKAYIDALLTASDAVVYKGVVDCSTNPQYPAANAGYLYRVSVAGKIGGIFGPNVEAGDTLICLVDGSAAGSHAAVGANWNVIQVNIDGAVIGPAAATDSDFAMFNGATGKLLKDTGLKLDTDGTLAANSDARVPSEKAVKTYVDAKGAGGVTKAELEEFTKASAATEAPEEKITPSIKNSLLTFNGKNSTIKEIAITKAGHVITLEMAGTWTLLVKHNEEGNIMLARSRDAELNARESITLMCDGAKWIELSRGKPLVLNDNTLGLYGNTRRYVPPSAMAARVYADGHVPVFNVKAEQWGALKDTGAAGDGVTDDRAIIQEALDAAAAAGGGVVFVPAGTYIVKGALEVESYVTIRGAGPRATILKLGTGVNTSVLVTKRYAAGGETGGTEETSVENIGFDGNFANNGATPAGTPVLGIDGIRPRVWNIDVRNGKVNFVTQQSRPWSPGTEKLEDGVYDRIGLKDPQEENAILAGPHDSRYSNILARSNVAGFPNIRTGGTAPVVYNSHCYGNAKYAWQLGAATELYACQGEGGREGQVAVFADGCSIQGGRYYNGGGADGKIGILIGDATRTANSTLIEGVRVENCTNGAFILGAAGTGNCRVSGWCNGTEGEAVKGSTGSSRVFDLKISGGMQFGGAPLLLAELAAANELELPANNRVIGRPYPIKITGATEIKKMKVVPPAGSILVLLFTSTAKVVDGENLKLAGNLEGGANRTLTLLSDGTNMIELARAVT